MNSWLGTLLAFGLGILYVALGYPLYRRMVKPNALYGFRIRHTLDDPEVWYPVNERSGRHFIITGVVLILLGAISLIVAQSDSRQQFVMAAALALSLGGPLYSGLICYRMARALTAERKQSRTLPASSRNLSRNRDLP